MGSTFTPFQCPPPCGLLATPNYPDLYPDGSTVTWDLVIKENHYIYLEFINFHVESLLKSCDQDYVEAYNIIKNGDRELIGRYCVANLPPAVLLSSTNQLGLVFKSDTKYPNTGFMAYYTSKQYTLPGHIKEKIKISGEYKATLYQLGLYNIFDFY